MTEYARLVLAVDSTSAKKATDDLGKLSAQSEKTERATTSLSSALRPLAAAFAGLKVGELIKDSTLLASRYDQLGLIINVVGRNVGRSAESLDQLEAALQKTGISAIQSRNNIIKMISANIDLSKATDLARLAQDAAAVAGTSSSEAFARLVRGIQSAEKETLETLGLNVNFQQSYEKLAAQLGKTANELTTVEKTQAATNAALEAGRNIAGSYEASLDNAGKQLQSATRYLEDFQVKLGAAFQPAFATGVNAYSDSLKFLSENVEGVVQALETGLYIALARGTSVVATNTTALVLQAVQQAKNNALAAESAAFEVRKIAAAKAAALADLEKARASEVAAIAALSHARANQQLFAIQVALSRGTAEYAALSKGLAVIDRELAASEQAVALATANRTAATAAAATASGALAKATAASTAANVASAASTTLAGRAMTGVAAVGGRLLGLLGGPVGLALTVGAVALSFVDFSSDADDAKVSADALTGSVNNLSTAADRARTRFAGLLSDVSKLNKAELTVRTEGIEDALKKSERDLKRYQRQFEAGNGSISIGLIDQTKANIEVLRGELERLGVERKAQENSSTKEGQAYITRLAEQKALLGVVTEQERVRAQIKAGLLKLSPDEEKQALALAAEVDAYEASTRAAQESARAGEQSAEQKLRSSEQLLESYKSTEAALVREIALFDEVSGAASLRYELENGSLSKLNEQQQLRLIGLAEELDRLNAIKKERDEAEATGEYTAALRDQIDARRNAIDIEVEAIGIGTQQAELLRELNSLEFEYAKRLEELARAQGTSAALSAEAYQARVDALRAAMAEEVSIVQEGAARKAEAEGNALNGVRKSVQDYIDEAGNLASQFENVTSNTIGGLEDGLAQFITTGKLSFKDLADSIIADLARVAAQQLIAGAASAAFGGAGGAAGGGLAGLFAGFFDRGGNIPAGQFGIVGEKGPEIVRGPANVTGREDTAKMMGGRSVSIGQMVFPGITNANEARQATAVAGRNIAKLVSGAGRYA